MSLLLIQSCSKSKNRAQEPVQPLELYSGYFFKIIKKAIREGEFQHDIDICVLSAKYGLVDATDQIRHYDRRMNSSRAAQLRPAIRATLEEKIEEEGYEHVICNLGAEYRSALGDVTTLPATVEFLEGEGIGHKGHLLKKVVRGDYSQLDIEVDNATA